MKKNKIYSFIILCLIQVSCKENKINFTQKEMIKETTNNVMQNFLETKNFEATIDNKETHLYWIENNGLKAAFTNYGGRLVGLWLADKNGKLTDVVVGMNSVVGFQRSTEPYFGATIGRVGNRIAKGKFTLEGKEYNVPLNNGENALHGGKKGFQDMVWNAEKKDAHTLILNYTSADMEQGFPGKLEVKVTYSITTDKTLIMEYEATTDKTTIVNLTNHAFFNLNGEGSGSILNHELQLFAHKYTPVDAGLIPTGKLANVEKTPFDFLEKHTIGEHIETKNEQLKFGNGYDHNFVLNRSVKTGMNHAAIITGDKSGISMDIYTAEPGIQFYSGNFMLGKNTFKSGAKDDFRTAFALETQHFPDTPNQLAFPSIALKPGKKYKTVSQYQFSVK
jgi:aldose 1-epimerase